MNPRIYLTVFFLFGIGIFANAQDKKQSPPPGKPIVENGADAIPVTVNSSTKKHKPNPPKAPEPVKFTPPTIVKDGEKPVPPPPPPPPAASKDKKGNMPPPPPPPLLAKKPHDGKMPPPPPPPPHTKALIRPEK